MDDSQIDISQEMKSAGFVYRKPNIENMSDCLKKKYELAKKLCNYKIEVDLNKNECDH